MPRLLLSCALFIRSFAVPITYGSIVSFKFQNVPTNLEIDTQILWSREDGRMVVGNVRGGSRFVVESAHQSSSWTQEIKCNDTVYIREVSGSYPLMINDNVKGFKGGSSQLVGGDRSQEPTPFQLKCSGNVVDSNKPFQIYLEDYGYYITRKDLRLGYEVCGNCHLNGAYEYVFSGKNKNASWLAEPVAVFSSSESQTQGAKGKYNSRGSEEL